MKLISKELVSLEYRTLLQQDMARATVCRFLVAYISQNGLNSIGRHLLNRVLREPRSFGVGSISCVCGYDPLVNLQQELGPNFQPKLKYFMDPKVMDSDEPNDLSLFHSKLVYLFLEREHKSIVYLGSHNWTSRALGPGSPRNAEASVRLEFEFSPDHLTGTGPSVPSEVNRHLLSAWDAPLCYPATPDQEPRFEEWMQKGCHRASATTVKEATVILAVCKSVPQPGDWLNLQNSGIYMQALDEEEGWEVWDTNAPIFLLVWESPAALAAAQQPFILVCKKTATNSSPKSRVGGNNKARSPMEGYQGIVLDEARLAAMQGLPSATRPPVNIWSGRQVSVFDFDFPTTRPQSSQVDGAITPYYQLYLQTEAVIFPAGGSTPPRAQFAWERETFAFAESKDAARFEEAPGYYAEPECKDRILTFLRDVLHVNTQEARVLPFSELDAKVGKRISRHPLHDTYIDRETRSSRADFYAKSTRGMLIPEIDEPTAQTASKRQRALLDEPLSRIQRVFTMPLKELFSMWTNTANDLRSHHSDTET